MTNQLAISGPRGRELERARARRGGRGIRCLLPGVALVLTSGCITKRVWTWAGEGKYTFVPSDVVSLGLSSAEGRPDRLYIRVDTPTPRPAPEETASHEGEYYVIEVPREWRKKPTTAVLDDAHPGSLQLSELLVATRTHSVPPEVIPALRSIPLQPMGRFPALDAAPYALVQGPPGVLFVYGADTARGGWTRLSSMITGEVVAAPAPRFNYAIAVVATPVTAAVDAVGITLYAIAWPFWTTMNIGYEDEVDGVRAPDSRYPRGRVRKELEKPPLRAEEAPVPSERG